MTAARKTRSGTRASRVADVLDGEYGRRRSGGRRSNPLDTLIGTLLSQNTNDRNSYKAWVSLRRKFPTWERVVAAPRPSVAAAIKVGGLKNQKARRIKEILRRVKQDWGAYNLSSLRRKTNDEVMEYLLSMKGIGEKTAACVLVFSLNRDVFPVDTHIHRICNRLGLVKTKSAEETFRAMESKVPVGRAYSFHLNLIRFGREVCKSSKPICGECILYDECTFVHKHELAHASARSRHKRSGRKDFLITEQLSKKRL